jgi:hypothetical protein
VEAKDYQSHWQTVFFVSAAISVAGTSAYVSCVRADIDPRLASSAAFGKIAHDDSESSFELLDEQPADAR